MLDLERRLRYLVFKYSPRAPYWQFVLWARQLFLMIFQAALDNDIAQAVVSLSILLGSLGLHYHVWPYAFRFQNQLEVLLGSGSILLIGFGILVHEIFSHDEKKSYSPVLFGLLILLGPTALFVLYKFASGGRQRALSVSIQETTIFDQLLGAATDQLFGSAAAEPGPSGNGTTFYVWMVDEDAKQRVESGHHPL